MSDGDDKISVLRRKLGKAGGPGQSAAPLTPTRAVRMSFAKAADDMAGWAVSVSSVTDEIAPLDTQINAFEDDWLFIVLEGPNGPAGLGAVDHETRAALIEMQTLGALMPAKPEPRLNTNSDAALVAPIFAAFMSELVPMTADTPLQGWARGYSAAEMLPSLRSASLILDDMDYRLMCLNLDFGVGDRQGHVSLMLPAGKQPNSGANNQNPDQSASWGEQLSAQVMSAPAEMVAELHRMRLPLREIEAWEPGHVLELPGVFVGSAKLMGADGAYLAKVRLGQVNGMRAVRVETAPPPELQTITHGQPARGEIPTGAPTQEGVGMLSTDSVEAVVQPPPTAGTDQQVIETTPADAENLPA